MSDIPTSKKRVLIAGFQHETNTFAPTLATFDSFDRGEGRPALPRQNEVLGLRDINIPIGGFIQSAEAEGWQLLPVLWASASPSARVTADAYERITSEILAAVRHHHFDAIYLDLHGAMVSEDFDDGEGELLRRIRLEVGEDLPIVASLDLHANVTEAMLTHATSLVAFRTYPHIDMARTGSRAALLLKSLFDRPRKMKRAYRRLPFLIPINSMCTLIDPASSMYQILEELENSGVESLSFSPGFPAADFPGCGPVIWGYGDDSDVTEAAVKQLYEKALREEALWKCDFMGPAEAVAEALSIVARGGAKGPVVIADTQDNPGAGADSNTAGMLRALVEANAENAALGLMVDAEVAAHAHSLGIGRKFRCTFGGKTGLEGDVPFTGEFQVMHLSNGVCRYDGPMMNGLEVSLGAVACLRINGISVIVSSKKAQMIDRNLYRMGGIEPERMSILVNKSSVHFRADFQSIARAVLIAKSPGPMLADPADLPWQNLLPGIRLAPNGPEFRS